MSDKKTDNSNEVIFEKQKPDSYNTVPPGEEGDE